MAQWHPHLCGHQGELCQEHRQGLAKRNQLPPFAVSTCFAHGVLSLGSSNYITTKYILIKDRTTLELVGSIWGENWNGLARVYPTEQACNYKSMDLGGKESSFTEAMCSLES